jgi:hypothetical protein
VVISQPNVVTGKKKKIGSAEKDDNAEMIDNSETTIDHSPPDSDRDTIHGLDAEGDDPAAAATPEGT